MWIVGRLHDPKPEDKAQPHFSLTAAITAAREAGERDWSDVFAVWDKYDEVVCIFTDGQQFTPV